jgi:hypothetical protein
MPLSGKEVLVSRGNSKQNQGSSPSLGKSPGDLFSTSSHASIQNKELTNVGKYSIHQHPATRETGFLKRKWKLNSILLCKTCFRVEARKRYSRWPRHSRHAVTLSCTSFRGQRAPTTWLFVEPHKQVYCQRQQRRFSDCTRVASAPGVIVGRSESQCVAPNFYRLAGSKTNVPGSTRSGRSRHS